MNSMKQLLFATFVALTVLIIGCGNLFEKVGDGIKEAIKSGNTLVFTITWYYKVNNKWPYSREELTTFINKHKAPIDLSKYDEIVLSEDEMGNLKCSYRIGGPISGYNGRFSMTKDEALNTDFPLRVYPEAETIEIKKP
jgi:hypothetical protein